MSPWWNLGSKIKTLASGWSLKDTSGNPCWLLTLLGLGIWCQNLDFLDVSIVMTWFWYNWHDVPIYLYWLLNNCRYVISKVLKMLIYLIVEEHLMIMMSMIKKENSKYDKWPCCHNKLWIFESFNFLGWYDKGPVKMNLLISIKWRGILDKWKDISP